MVLEGHDGDTRTQGEMLILTRVETVFKPPPSPCPHPPLRGRCIVIDWPCPSPHLPSKYHVVCSVMGKVGFVSENFNAVILVYGDNYSIWWKYWSKENCPAWDNFKEILQIKFNKWPDFLCTFYLIWNWLSNILLRSLDYRYVHIEIVSISDKITWNIFDSSSNMFIQHFKWKIIWKSDKINIPNYNNFLRENIKGNSEALMLFDQTKKKFCQKFLWLIN